MTKYGFWTAWLLVAACGGDARDTAVLTPSGSNATPTPTRGYLRDPGHDERPDVHAARPVPATPMDPALVGPDQPENVRVKP
jgi:hypothetical protein